ncbi:MAG TPA: hypothetical protein VFB38_07675 [Chthonomonadaceae bacterium]|nr:hypothetical protein [Chthonomonadaceae bacterium]
MADSVPTVQKKRRSRIIEYLVVLILIGIVVVAALYQEQLSAFFGLHMWDRGAPARTVAEFLQAGKNGDQKQADSCLIRETSYKPLMQNGKWAGYYIITQAGRMDLPMADLVPPGEPKPINTEFITMGKGAAEVTMPDSRNKPLVYRLEMSDNGWKITEIRGGHPAQQAKPSGPNAKQRGGPLRPPH